MNKYYHISEHLFPGIQALSEINNQQTISLWEVMALLRIKISCATYVNVKELGKVGHRSRRT